MSDANRNPYRLLVDRYTALLDDPVPPAEPLRNNPAAMTGPKAMLFSPHPDDECIVGGLALRLQRERQWQVMNVAVTLGSKKERRAERWQELQNACAYLGFELQASREGGLQNINPEQRANSPENWSAAVESIAKLLRAQQPQVVFLPHAEDWNRTHIGTHYLLLDALAKMPADFSCSLLETEFWGAMQAPNLMVEIDAAELADLMYALALHRGEVARNPYHMRLPAWMIDNVRRGAEVVGGQGAQAPNFSFATLYRLRYWRAGQLHDISLRQSCIARDEWADIVFSGVTN